MLVLNANTGVSMVQDNTITSTKIVDGAVGDTKVNFTANNPEVKEALNASGTAPIYACRAWVNFNGTGTVAIRASGNVSSITDNGVGDYTVNFTTAMPDRNYVLSGNGQYDGADNYVGYCVYIRASTITQNYQLATSTRIITSYTPGTGTATGDSSNVMVSFHR